VKNKRVIVLLAAAIFLLAGGAASAQTTTPSTTQQSIDEQIQQKEAELKRLKEIKKRQDQIKQLQLEMDQLRAGQDVVPSSATPGAPPADLPANETHDAPSANNPGAGTQSNPALRRAAAPSSTQASTAAVADLTDKAAADPNIPTLRSCSEVDVLSRQRPDPTSLFERYFCNAVVEIQEQKLAEQARRRTDKDFISPLAGLDLARRDFFTFMIVLLAREGRANYVIAAENERVDKEVGADASSSGSTSLVSKGSVPSILGFAVNNGALLRSNSGSTVTFRGNVAGVAKALAGKGFISGYDEDSAATRFLRRTSFSFTFDPTRGSQPGIFTGDKQQISNYSFRMDLYNKRDPRQPRYRQDWRDFLSGSSNALSSQIQSSLVSMVDLSSNTWNDPELRAWYALTEAAIRNASGDQVEAVLKDQLNRVPSHFSEATVTELRSFDERFKDWLDARERILEKIAKAPIVTFEYTNDRPLNEPSLSKFNMIAELGFGPKLDLTFNGALTLFNKRPATPGVNRVRDFQFATQLDMPFGELGLGMGKPVLSFAGRYERLMADATLAGLPVPNTEGDIGVGQIKLVIPIKNSGVRIPFSFSFANRTELIREKEVRGNFGFTFDLDTIFAKFKPF
jgi:hypothetical protein